MRFCQGPSRSYLSHFRHISANDTSHVMSNLASTSSPPVASLQKKRQTPLTPPHLVKALFVQSKQKRKQKHPQPDPYSPADVLWHDIGDFLGHEYVAEKLKAGVEWDPPVDLIRGEEVVVRVRAFTVSGESSPVPIRVVC